MRKLVLPAIAAAAFGLTPFVAKLGAVPSSLLLVGVGVALALAASGSTSAIAVAAGALGAFAGHVLGVAAPAAGGAVLVVCAFAERTMRVRGTNARLVHLGAAAVAGGLAGSLAAAYASGSPVVRGVAILVCTVLASLPLLVVPDDPLAASLEASSRRVSDPARAALRDAAELRRQVHEVALDDVTRVTVAATWRALGKLAESRVRVERTRTLVTGAMSPAAAVSATLDRRITEHVTALARAYTACDVARAAATTLEDGALKSAEMASESLEEKSRALVDVS